MKALVLCLFVALTVTAQTQQLPKSQVFFQNTETDTASFGISCDNRQSWKPVTLKGHEGQRFQCDSLTAQMWGHINTDIAGAPHQEAELAFQNGGRYELYFDQTAHKWNLRVMGAASSSTSSTGSTSPGTNDEAAIQAIHAAWIAAIRGRNLVSIADLFTDDCIFLPSSAPQVSGKEGVRKMYEKKFAQYGSGMIDAQGEIQEIQIFGDTAFWRGTNSITSQGGSPNKSSGYGMGLLRRGSDGKWRFSRVIMNEVRGS